MLRPKFSAPNHSDALSASPRGSGMRRIRHHRNSRADASTRRTALAQTGASASLPMLMARNVVPQIAAHAANASQGREPVSWSAAAAGSAIAALRRPRLNALRDLRGREAEVFLELCVRRGLPEPIDADRESGRSDQAMPALRRPGFDRDAPAAGWEHGVARRGLLREEELRRGHAH